MTNIEKIRQIEAKLAILEETMRRIESTTLATLCRAEAFGAHLRRTRESQALRREVTAELIQAYRAEIEALRRRVVELEGSGPSW